MILDTTIKLTGTILIQSLSMQYFFSKTVSPTWNFLTRIEHSRTLETRFTFSVIFPAGKLVKIGVLENVPRASSPSLPTPPKKTLCTPRHEISQHVVAFCRLISRAPSSFSASFSYFVTRFRVERHRRRDSRTRNRFLPSWKIKRDTTRAATTTTTTTTPIRREK